MGAKLELVQYVFQNEGIDTPVWLPWLGGVSWNRIWNRIWYQSPLCDQFIWDCWISVIVLKRRYREILSNLERSSYQVMKSRKYVLDILKYLVSKTHVTYVISKKVNRLICFASNQGRLWWSIDGSWRRSNSYSRDCIIWWLRYSSNCVPSCWTLN